jgi:hypothetical protein
MSWEDRKRYQEEDKRERQQTRRQTTKSSGSSTNEAQARKQVQELLKVENGLTQWETDFLDDMDDTTKDYSDRQREVIAELWERLVNQIR